MSGLKTFMVAAMVVVWAVVGPAQWIERPQTGSSQAQLADLTKMSGMTGLGPALEAELERESENAKEKKAVIRAAVWGVNLVDPNSVKEPSNTQAFLAYTVDRNAPVVTAEKEYTFANLTPGEHIITVRLMAAQNLTIGVPKMVKVEIPK